MSGTYVIRKGHLWTPANVGKAKTQYKYVEIGPSIVGYGKNLGMVRITGAPQMFKRFPDAVYIIDLRVVGRKHEIVDFLREINGGDLKRYQCYTLDNFSTTMKDSYDAECKIYRDSQAETEAGKAGVPNSLTARLDVTKDGFSLDVSGMNDDGTGVKIIRASGNPVSKLRIDPLRISSDSIDRYQAALNILKKEGKFADNDVDHYMKAYVDLYEKRNKGNASVLRVLEAHRDPEGSKS